METNISETRIKELFKEALIEVLEERKDFVYSVLSEIIEDIAMVNAIREGENSESVNPKEIFEIMERRS